MRTILFLAIGVLALSGRARAAEETRVLVATVPEQAKPSKSPNQARGFIGAGVASLPRYQGADERLIIPMVVGRVDYADMYAEIRGLGARFDVLPIAGIALGPTFNLRFPRSASVDNARIAALPEIGRAAEVGVFVAKTFAAADLRTGFTMELEGRADVSGTYSGATVGLGASAYHVFGQAFVLSVDGSTTFYDNNYAKTYFSVSGAAANASGLQAYDATAGLGEATLASTLVYTLTRHLRVIGRAQVSRLLGDAKDSPIAREGSATGLLFGTALAWAF